MKIKRAYEDEVISTECGAKNMWVELVPGPSNHTPPNPEALAVEVMLNPKSLASPFSHVAYCVEGSGRLQ